MNAIAAGAAYFAIVFAAGFVLGTVRTLLLAPAVGPVAAVAMELPVMLGLAWIACGRLVRRFAIPSGWPARLVMGGVAFALLMAAEAALAILAFGQSPAAYLAGLTTQAGLLGLAGQVAFALIPLARG